ncbi:ABC-three component system middle component 5 [Cyclobacterium amurskyense]|uniref:Uncharacterized protein n=1 Tax=Cyclobacterium amurskyense TaxID=320787 RepID=A0A0H4PBQ4_9BACT|nr:ABC-three component system middle component 5 [Cyclobacterium amurskyense]AKP50238.1 hypothetical protein CA2015_0779 [Cyclobacterium amurskyense]
MIVYQPAYDLYHSVYRLVKLLSFFHRGEFVEIDRLRIWDYYFLYPNRLKYVKLKLEEKDIKELIKNYILRPDNPYELIFDDRKMFEKIRPYQMSAIKYLASIGVINKDYLKENKVTKISEDVFRKINEELETMTVQEDNTLKLLTSHFFLVPLYGKDGLKEKTNLLESRYDG